MPFYYILITVFLLGLNFSSAFAQSHYSQIEEKIENESDKEANEAQNIVNYITDKGESLISRFSPESLNVEAPAPSPETGLKPLPYDKSQHWWWTLFKENRLNLRDTSVVYPKFVKFCVDVYNWGDRTFNTFDPEYVQSTGKRWKVRIVSDNWLDSYAMRFPNHLRALMSSDVYANIGAYIQYMAVSVGSSYDVNKLFKKHQPSHKKYEFGFICALFNAELYYHENQGGTNIKRLGDFHEKTDGKAIFPGLRLYTLGFDAYYFFNNKKYSQGAAYNFAKYQMKSQGSFMLGFSFTNQKLHFDFSELPDNLKQYWSSSLSTNYYYHYNSYCILFGYGYNWVLAPKLLFNATLMPSVGLSRFYEDSFDGDKIMASLNISGRISLTYNLGNYFFGLFGKMKGQWYQSGHQSLFSSIENFSAYVGLRF